MEEKSYEQMRAEFEEFYNNKILPGLPDFEKCRKTIVQKKFAFNITFLSIAMLMLSVGAFIFSFILNTIFDFVIPSRLYISLPLIGKCIAVFFILPFILLGYLTYITRNDKRNSEGAVELEYDSESLIKNKIKIPFINIFSNNADWIKAGSFCYKDRYRVYRNSNIFNTFPVILFDDIISMNVKDVNVSICEISTSLFAGVLKLIIIFLFAMLSLVFHIFFVIAIVILLVKFAKKIYLYSPFRGVVVELAMNKNFNGHTFFIDKSISAKKIQIDKEKFEVVNLESVDFAKKYTTYSTDQIEARYLLTTSMIERLDNLKLSFNAKYIRGSFKDDKLILAIATDKDMFAMGSDFKETNYQTFETLFNEIVSILKIVDQLKLYEKTGL